MTAAGPEGAVGIGFAVPIDTAKAILPQLEAHMVVTRSYLGIRGVDGADGLVALAGGSSSGVRVGDVDPVGPAARAGVLGATSVDADGGDVIVAVAGRPVHSMADVEEVVQRHRPGDGLALRLLREGKPLTVQVQLTERPASVPPG